MKTQTLQNLYLSDLSPVDKPWDEKRYNTCQYRDLYRGTYFDKYAARLDNCSGILEFRFDVAEDGLAKLKLQSAKFCRVRHCPVCQWRRSLMWKARFYEALPKILTDYPKARFIFLTLTVRNCELVELRETISEMNKAWKLLTKLKQFPALGWVKSIEVTRAVDDTAHPHIHALLMVKPSYFKTGYISQDKWSLLWQNALRVTYKPVVDVRTVKEPKQGVKSKIEGVEPGLVAAIQETLKYQVKPGETVNGTHVMSDQDWLIELTNQLHKTRAIATGGVFKTYLAGMEVETDESLCLIDSESDENDLKGPHLISVWKEKARRYKIASD